jgi:hypothetical protein
MVKVRKVNKLRVAVVPKDADCSELTEENAALYYTAAEYAKPVFDMVVSEFEGSLKKEAGLEKRLRRTKNIELKKGDIRFKIKATPSTSTAYQAVCQRFADYLEDLNEAAEAGVKRQGIRNIEGGTYVGLAEAEAKFEQLKDYNTNPRVTPRISCSTMKDQSLDNMLGVVEVEPEECGKFTEANAKLYRVAKAQASRIKKQVTDPFKKALKAETGYSGKNPPAETVYELYEIGDYVFQVCTVPKDKVSYGEIAKGIQDIFNQAVVETGIGRSSSDWLKVRDGQGFLNIDYMIEQYEKLKEENTKMTVEQTITVMPKPEYDSVVSV